MDDEQWSYCVLRYGNERLGELDRHLDVMGAAGWELGTSTSTVKRARVGPIVAVNELVFVFKKRGLGHKRPDGVIPAKSDFEVDEEGNPVAY